MVIWGPYQGSVGLELKAWFASTLRAPFPAHPCCNLLSKWPPRRTPSLIDYKGPGGVAGESGGHPGLCDPAGMGPSRGRRRKKKKKKKKRNLIGLRKLIGLQAVRGSSTRWVGTDPLDSESVSVEGIRGVFWAHTSVRKWSDGHLTSLPGYS
jgi:hypothetical protein